MKKHSSIKTKFNIILTIVVCVIVVMQIVFISYVTDMFDEQNNNIADNITYQITSNVNTKLDNLQKIQKSINSQLYPHKFLEEKENEREVRDYVNKLQEFNADYIFLVVFDEASNSYNFSSNMITEEYELIKKAYENYRSLPLYGTSHYDFFSYDMNSFKDTYVISFEPVRTYDYEKLEYKRLGTSVVCNKVSIKSIVQGVDEWQNISLSLVNGDNSISFLKPNDGLNDKVINKSLEVVDTFWKINIGFHTNDKASINSMIKKIIIFETIIIALLILLIHHILKIDITIPIQKIIAFLDNYLPNSKKTDIKINVNSDIGIIFEHINAMLKKNKDITRKMINTQKELYESELTKNQAVLYALQNQINPHFLYNSLECVRSIANIYNISEIEEISTAISKIMRYTLDTNNFVEVNAEIDIIVKYLNIMKIRFNNKFTYNINVSDDILKCKMIKMILQPLVENVFNHGLLENGNHIDVKGELAGNIFKFTIRDNGAGIEARKLDEINRSIKAQKGDWRKEQGGIGLVNIDNRIKLNYGNNFGIQILSKEGEYTEIIIRIPKKE